MDFSKIVLMTDLDGTLLTDDKQIHPSDMAAINRFRDGGGVFTMATGRGYSMAKPVAKRLSLDVPAVVFNGAAVYDFSQGKFLWHSALDACAREYVVKLLETFPNIAIEVLCEKQIYVLSVNEIERQHLALEHIEPKICNLNDIPSGDWLKVLVAYPPDKIQKIIDFAQENFGKKVHWVRSEAHYYEMLPLGVNKGSGFKQLLRLLGRENAFTVGVGDYNNDLEMIQNASLGVAVASAQESIKSEADLVVCDNNSGALAEVIDYIEKL